MCVCTCVCDYVCVCVACVSMHGTGYICIHTCVCVCVCVCVSVRPSIRPSLLCVRTYVCIQIMYVHNAYSMDECNNINIYYIVLIIISHRHTVESGQWGKFKLTQGGQGSNTSGISLRDAIDIWLTTANETHPVEFRDSCYTAHCNELCPEEINFELDNSHLWNNRYEIFVYCIVGMVTLVCIILKGIFFFWHRWLLWNQELFLERSSKVTESGVTINFQVSNIKIINIRIECVILYKVVRIVMLI